MSCHENNTIAHFLLFGMYLVSTIPVFKSTRLRMVVAWKFYSIVNGEASSCLIVIVFPFPPFPLCFILNKLCEAKSLPNPLSGQPPSAIIFLPIARLLVPFQCRKSGLGLLPCWIIKEHPEHFLCHQSMYLQFDYFVLLLSFFSYHFFSASVSANCGRSQASSKSPLW